MVTKHSFRLQVKRILDASVDLRRTEDEGVVAEVLFPVIIQPPSNAVGRRQDERVVDERASTQVLLPVPDGHLPRELSALRVLTSDDESSGRWLLLVVFV